MCRLAAYLGPPAPLSTLLYDPPRSLEVQAYAPREQLSGRVNVDGTGLAWWQAGEPDPLRYVTDRPPWADPNLPGLAPRLRAGGQLAVVRGATSGIGHGTVFVPPFTHGRVAGAHNGFVADYRARVARALVDRLPDHLHARLGGLGDSEALFLLAAARLEDDPAGGLRGAAAAAVREAAALCAKLDVPATLTLVLADGRAIVATRAATATAANSLYTLSDSARWPGARVLASEPLDDDAGWDAVPDGSLVELTSDGVRVAPLEF
ncbi:MAG TPA: class II glutamine amidotransferase [Egibacteraceae bacterium]|jgi:gamma-glutamyl hercynylcysteine S-oxide hydrolase|nr:class II glutamine amidotransferase [Egibacteraceae bacterium]